MKDEDGTKDQLIDKLRQRVKELEASEMERRRAEEILQESERRYRILAENVTDVIWVVGLDRMQITYVSPSVARLRGYSPEEAMSQTLEETLTPSSVKMGRKAVERTLAFRRRKDDRLLQPLTLELEMTCKDGSTIWTESVLTVQRDPGGQSHLVVGMARDITERKRSEETLRRSESQLRLLSQRILEIQEEERARIARDLHDQLGQELVFLKIKAVSLAEQLGGASVLHEPARELLDLIDRTRATSHRIAVNIRPGILDDLGLMKAIQWYAGEFEQSTSIACLVDTPAADLNLPQTVATAAYRILQEALTNVWKHAGASQVKVKVDKKGETVILRISDNGAGFDSSDLSEGSSLGLLGMRERARLVGGTLRVSSRCGKGTQIVARLPAHAG